LAYLYDVRCRVALFWWWRDKEVHLRTCLSLFLYPKDDSKWVTEN